MYYNMTAIPQLISLDDCESKLYNDIKTLKSPFVSNYSFYVTNTDMSNKYIIAIDTLMLLPKELIKTIVEYNIEIITLQYRIDYSVSVLCNIYLTELSNTKLDINIYKFTDNIHIDANICDFIYTTKHVIDCKYIKDEYNNDFRNFINFYMYNKYGFNVCTYNYYELEYIYESSNVIVSPLKRRTVNHYNLTAVYLFIKKMIDAIKIMSK